jgi:hypothetical protein
VHVLVTLALISRTPPVPQTLPPKQREAGTTEHHQWYSDHVSTCTKPPCQDGTAHATPSISLSGPPTPTAVAHPLQVRGEHNSPGEGQETQVYKHRYLVCTVQHAAWTHLALLALSPLQGAPQKRLQDYEHASGRTCQVGAIWSVAASTGNSRTVTHNHVSPRTPARAALTSMPVKAPVTCDTPQPLLVPPQYWRSHWDQVAPCLAPQRHVSGIRWASTLILVIHTPRCLLQWHAL